MDFQVLGSKKVSLAEISRRSVCLWKLLDVFQSVREEKHTRKSKIQERKIFSKILNLWKLTLFGSDTHEMYQRINSDWILTLFVNSVRSAIFDGKTSFDDFPGLCFYIGVLSTRSNLTECRAKKEKTNTSTLSTRKRLWILPGVVRKLQHCNLHPCCTW